VSLISIFGFADKIWRHLLTGTIGMGDWLMMIDTILATLYSLNDVHIHMSLA
jgi:hypothetical protein